MRFVIFCSLFLPLVATPAAESQSFDHLGGEVAGRGVRRLRTGGPRSA